jgi:hypothetical protein
MVRVGDKTVGFPVWQDMADWANSWVIFDATVEDGRVVRVEDPSGFRPLVPFPTLFALLGATPLERLPSPLYIGSSDRFNGAPGLFCDHQPQYTGSVFGDLFSALTPNVNEAQTEGVFIDGTDSAIYFNPPHGYVPPYWVAVLGRLGLGDDPLIDPNTGSSGIWDATHGGTGTGPTIGRKLVRLGGNSWRFSTFGPGLLLVSTPHDAVVEETVLVIVSVNGASSFIEVNWRTATGVLSTSRTVGNMRNWNYREAFLGWVHGPYWMATGIRLGAPNEAEINRVRLWASYFIPPAGALPDEP